jgi:serine/threonine-protein kinase HipA
MLSPAYDLINVNLVYPKDKEDLALTLNGRKSNIQRSDFDQFAYNLGISEKARDNIYEDFSQEMNKVQDWVERSFLSEEYKEKYLQIIQNKQEKIGL